MKRRLNPPRIGPREAGARKRIVFGAGVTSREADR